MKWISTKIRDWKAKCEELQNQGEPFELREARSIEHMAFVQAFCIRFEWSASQRGNIIIFSPAPKS